MTSPLFIADATHGDSSLGETDSIPAGTTWCSNSSPASQIKGFAQYHIEPITYIGIVDYP